MKRCGSVTEDVRGVPTSEFLTNYGGYQLRYARDAVENRHCRYCGAHPGEFCRTSQNVVALFVHEPRSDTPMRGLVAHGRLTT